MSTPGPRKRNTKRNHKQRKASQQEFIQSEIIRQEPLYSIEPLAEPVPAELTRAIPGDNLETGNLPGAEYQVNETSAVELTPGNPPTAEPRRKRWSKWLWLAAGAFLVFQFYYVQEMLAILVIFAALFVVFAIIAGIVYAVGRAGESTISAAEPVARRGLELAEEVSKKTFRRPRSAPAP